MKFLVNQLIICLFKFYFIIFFFCIAFIIILLYFSSEFGLLVIYFPHSKFEKILNN